MNFTRLILLSFTLSLPMISNAEGHRVELDKDPFKQPDILKYKPPIASPAEEISAEDIEVPELELTATLISVVEPLVIVNQKMLRVGEEIEGMKLIVIDEGRAIFSYQGQYHEFTIDQPGMDNPRK